MPLAVALALGGCGEPLKPRPAGDTTAPAAVADLVATPVSQTEIRLTWTATGDDGATGTATGYEIRRSTAPIDSASFATAQMVSPTAPPDSAGSPDTLIVSSLSPSTTYHFALKAVDDSGNRSPVSNDASATTDALADVTAPAAIVDLSVTGTTETSVSLAWTAPGDDLNSGQATSYDLRYATAPINAGSFLSATSAGTLPTPAAAGTAEAYTVSGLAPSTSYYFAIRASDEVPNTSGLSNVVVAMTLTPPDTVRPAAVSDLSVLQAEPSFMILRLTATGDDSLTGTATGYELRRSQSPIDESNFESAYFVSGTPKPSPAGDPDTLASPGLSPGVTYWFAVKVFDEVGNHSALSNVVSAMTPAPPDTVPPASITTLAITGQTSDSVSLSWIASGNNNHVGVASMYDLRYSTSVITAMNFDAATTVSGLPTPAPSGTTESFTVTGLTAATTYYFAIKVADDALNWSGLSNVVSGSTLP